MEDVAEEMASIDDGGMPRRAKIIRFPGAPEPPAPTDSADPGDARRLVEVHRCPASEAVVVRSLLESEGIPTLLRSRLAHSVHPFTVGAQGEVVILVPESEAVRCQALLSRRLGQPLQ
jgi:hypothetical protein